MTKLHQNEEFLRRCVEQGLTSKEIAKDFHISYKLIEIYLRKYEIPFVSQQPSQ